MGSIVQSVLDPITGAGGVRDAASAAADQQRQAGITSANISAFRPVGMTTRFGTSNFTREIDPATGTPYISSAGYTASPELAAIQNRLFGQFGSGLTQAEAQANQYAPLSGASQSLFNLGSQYLAQSPEQAAQDYMNSQQALLSSSRANDLSRVQAANFARGTGGLGVNTGTGNAPSNPLAQALFNAQAQQDLQLAANAQQAGQQRTQYGASLFGTGAGLLGSQTQGQAGSYAPLQTQLGLAQNVETMAQQPYQLGLQLGAAQQPGQTAGSQLYNQGQLQGAATQYQGTQQANQMNSQFLSSLIGSAAGGFSGGGAGAMSAASGFNPSGFSSSFGNMFGNPLTALQYGTNIGSQQTRMLAAQDF